MSSFIENTTIQLLALQVAEDEVMVKDPLSYREAKSFVFCFNASAVLLFKRLYKELCVCFLQAKKIFVYQFMIFPLSLRRALRENRDVVYKLCTFFTYSVVADRK